MVYISINPILTSGWPAPPIPAISCQNEATATRYSELIILSIELHSNSTLFGG